MRKCLFGIYAFCIMMIMPALVHAYTTDDLVEDFEWKETDNTVEIAVGESYQLHYSCSTIGHGVFSDYYKNEGCWMYYSFSGGQHIISEPTGYSIDKNGVITGLKEGKWALKPTSLIIGKSGTDKWLYINVVSVKTEKESNNTLDTANEFTSKIKFCLDNQADIDYFKYKHNKKFGEYVKFKVNYLGSGDFPSFYKWSTYSAGQNVGSGSLMSQGQICKALVVSGEYVYFQVYFNTSYSQYYQYNDYFTVEVVEDDEPQDQSVTGVSLDATSLTLTEGETKMLTATVSPDNATNKNVSWSSSNAEVASVDKSGTVTAVKEGSATITVTTEDGGKTAICEVTVQAKAEPEPDEPSGTKMIIHKIDGEAVVYYVNEIDSVEFIPGPLHVQSITLSPANLVLDVEESATLTATVLPADADNVEVEWSSSDSDIAYVTQKGKVFTLDYGTCTITCTAKDGSGVSASCAVKVVDKSHYIDGYDYVDLGLPSGTLWATCNVGAIEPYDYGDYFAWGETEGYNSGKTTFNSSTYKYCNGSYDKLTKYCDTSEYGNNGYTDDLTTLEPVDDAAAANWGGSWRMPTHEEWQELCNEEYCKWIWYAKGNTEFNGVAGYKVESKMSGCEGNYIFLPATGDRSGSSFSSAGSDGYYWSSTLYKYHPHSAWYCYAGTPPREPISPYREADYGHYRYYGNSVRPVIPGTVPTVHVTSITLSSSSLTLEPDQTCTLMANVTPEDATNFSVEWSSSDESVATVSADGMVTAVDYGTCTITCTAKDGNGASASCTVTVPQHVTGMMLSESALTMALNQTIQLSAIIEPDNAYDKSVTWTSSDESIATVDATGLVTIVGGGNVFITATSVDNPDVSATCAISVPIYVTSITLSETSLLMEPDQNVKLSATVLPADAENQDVTWASSDSEVAMVTSAGKVIAIVYGTCTITCTATDGSGVSASCVVKVAKPLDLNGHTYVDLGLPSGTLWATCNVGADEPYDYGDYFAWGETEGCDSGKTTFNWSTYKYCKGSIRTMTKYCNTSEYGKNGFTDALTTLEAADDAAAANWGGDWRMPTHAEWQELNRSFYCTWTWYGSGNAEFGGKAGYKVESKKSGYEGNFIFLPAAGYRYDSSLSSAGSDGTYWSSSLYESYPSFAWCCKFGSRSPGQVYADYRYADYRYDGQSVRPVARP